MSTPYDGNCFNCEEPIAGLVSEDYVDDGFVECSECAESWDDGMRVLIDFEGGTFVYAPVTDPDDLEHRLGESHEE